ncbi:amino acid ABC transporter permease/ATP-binding protein [Pseudomonas syringae pv. syringae]|uniref:amino acid ABC transporter permease/ATP-binding protein n=1 Tax=Pseudomonas syringae TaxID=317 RepID=UPI00200B10F4|nr:amino acid ABC transporter permease/ATP-binding protein [Pseudomonas syringae]MCK9702323.1 amino acid ABC transporter permease/ATP-binding protein [Pseudomonas syringae pv. syringae]MCK9757999.1 amino acid ABC transporter permease/ATP-binding protein [Pseudomonas syringae pv. syringae]MCK9773653.1 amino acid ABC transporter permease/ATP-binding protein [Pseudomonas syringae pv. syringae]
MAFEWAYFFSLFSVQAFWKACLTVVQLSVLSWSAGLALGFLLASARLSTHAWLRVPASLYIWLFRSIPLLVLLVFVYNLPQLFPASSSVLSQPFYSGLIALVLTETAYMAEIHRGGLLSVLKGQREAARALGIRGLGAQRLVVIPQAIRISLPTLTNEYVTIVKLTSLVSVISLNELLLVGQRLYAQNFLVLETLAAVAMYYVLIVTLFGWLLQWAERHLDLSRKNARTLEDAQTDALRQPAGSGKPRCVPVPGQPDALLLRGIHKRYGNHEVLKGIDLLVRPGEVISIIGPSGSGKTSLIRTINNLESIDQGEIVLFGNDFIRAVERADSPVIRQGIRRIGMVFQNFNLFPHRTILDNVILAPRYHGLASTAQLRRKGHALLDRVGLLAHADKYPHQLSGGQQQRVAIARALAMEPDIMLFDEPTSALDPELVGDVLNVIRDLAAEGMTMLIVTHEMDFALSISDRIVFMENGHVVTDASPATIRQDGDPRVRRFIGLEQERAA